jgi:hypothetical protein
MTSPPHRRANTPPGRLAGDPDSRPFDIEQPGMSATRMGAMRRMAVDARRPRQTLCDGRARRRPGTRRGITIGVSRAKTPAAR